MLTGFIPANGSLTKIVVNQSSDLKPEMIWLDLTNPTEQERQWIKQAYAQELQFMEELGEIEASARFYRDEFGMHLNQYFLVTDYAVTRNVNVAFTINKDRLYTLRGEDLPAFRAFLTQTARNPEYCGGPAGIMLGIIETRVGLLADLYERAHNDLEPISQAIFRGDGRAMPRVLETLTRIEDVNGKARLGLLENKRAYPNLARSTECAQHVESINEILRDVDSLQTHSGFLADRAKFLMDAAMGIINISFNRRLNIFTVLSVVLMPPTLIASIYGMNFEHMPELKWAWGYPMALLLMVAVAIGPVLYLKRKGWL
ncbi:MAG: CorA family divalent cation transporter [Betaproteobacteria bacterium]